MTNKEFQKLKAKGQDFYLREMGCQSECMINIPNYYDLSDEQQVYVLEKAEQEHTAFHKKEMQEAGVNCMISL